MDAGRINSFLAAEGFARHLREYTATVARHQRHGLASAKTRLGLKALSGQTAKQAAAALKLDPTAFARYAYACEAVGLANMQSADAPIDWGCEPDGGCPPVDFDWVASRQKELAAQSSPQAWIVGRTYEYLLGISRHTMAADNILDCLSHGRTHWEVTRDHTMADIFNLYEREQRWLEIFQCAMFSGSLEDNLQIARVLDLDGKELLDVGGASATLALAAREVAPRLRRFDIYDRVGAEGICRRLAAAVGAELGEAALDTIYGGDFFADGPGLKGIPAGTADYDMVFVARILHDWERDEDVRLILSRCRSHLKPGGSICILERVMPPDRRGPTALYDFSMLATANGVERTQAEYDLLLRAAGYSASRMQPCASLKNILLARRE